MGQHKDVDQFHKKFGVDAQHPEKPETMEVTLFQFRHKFLQEELQEFSDAHGKNDIVKAVDSLIDLVYVAHGTALLMGVTPEKWNACWQAVHQANMLKIRVESVEESTNATGRGHASDVRKPDGWQSPEPILAAVLNV